MMEEQFKAIASDLDPLVISAPTIRCGTTLLQRLLCSSSKALIYGELCAQDLEFFLNLYAFKSRQYQTRNDEVATALDNVLGGDVNNWIPTLMPDLAEYLKALGRGAFSAISYCRDYARSVGRPVWGFKCPGWNSATVRLMRTTMPGARFIFIDRELRDCLRSAKAHGKAFGALYAKPEVEEFCRSWVENREYMLSLANEPAVLCLRFEELLREPLPTLARIAEFAGVDDMDSEVLSHRVNAWQSRDLVTSAKDGYLQPAELDEYDWQVINATRSLTVEKAVAC